MSKQLDHIDDEMAAWMDRQPVFFVASAPLSAQGHVNCPPKGGDCFRVLNPMQVAYLDFTGSGAETAAHVRENGRIVLMFCAFEGKPNPGARALVRVNVSRISTSCGFAVPFMEFRADRDTLDRWAAANGPDGLAEYRQAKNAQSIDGLPAL